MVRPSGVANVAVVASSASRPSPTRCDSGRLAEVSRLKSRANEGIQDAKSYLDQKKSKVREAYQEGQRAFEEEKEKQEAKAEKAKQEK